MPSAILTHITTDSVPGTLTETIFDTTSRADSAQILLTNSTGASKVIIAAWIRGKPVTRYSDSARPMTTGGRGGGGMQGARGGYLHDKFVDYESIAKNGERTFETGNNFTVTADQVNQLADYYWKLNKTKKHIYSLSLVGMQTWYEPGEWYTLQIGGAGQAEYIDSTVECIGVQCSLSAGGAPSASVAFREVEENWKFDSNEVARQIAAGDFSRRTNNNFVTVASQYYSGFADYYCDGTDDHIEIQAAADYLKNGVVRLTAGTFNITSITCDGTYRNLTFSGDAGKTVINCNTVATGTYAIGLLGNSTGAAYVYDIGVENISFTQASTSLDASVHSLVYARYSTRIKIVNCSFVNDLNDGTNDQTLAINLSNSWGCTLMTNTVVRQGTGIYTTGGSGNLIYGNVVTSARDSILTAGNHDLISNNIVNYGNVGIWIAGDSAQVSGNKIGDCVTRGLYIQAGASSVMVGSNLCHDNGDDVGISNTNSDNFYDSGTDTQWAG